MLTKKQDQGLRVLHWLSSNFYLKTEPPHPQNQPSYWSKWWLQIFEKDFLPQAILLLESFHHNPNKSTFTSKWKAPPEVYIRHKLYLSVALENTKSFCCSGWIGRRPLSLTHPTFPSSLRQPLRLLRGIPGARSILWQSMDGNLDSTRLSLIVFNIWCPFEEAYQFVSWHVLNWAGLVTMSQRRQWHPAPVLLPGKSHGWRSLMDCCPWGRYELDTTERLHFHFSLSCIGEGNGNPLQYSCLENPRDGGA